jgi:four helix bundle protein
MALNKSEEVALAQALDHEDLDVYKIALDFAAFAHCLTRALPADCAHLSDQLRRASSSVALNIAEGAGRIGAADKARFYTIAKGSVTECAATLDLLQRLGAIGASEHLKGKSAALRMAPMLTSLAKSVGARR